MKKKPADRHIDIPAEANRDKHINFTALENREADPADAPATGKLALYKGKTRTKETEKRMKEEKIIKQELIN